MSRFGLLAMLCLMALQAPAADATDVNRWYHYTRPTAEFGRPLKVLVVRGLFADRPDDEMLSEADMDYALQSMDLYYRDSSWGALQLEYTFTPIVTMPSSCYSTTCGTPTIKEHLIQLATDNGYTYCNGPCAADSERVGDYDQLIMVFKGANPSWSWAGIAVVGNGVTWVKTGSASAGVLEHELGHNFGIGHGNTANWNRAAGFNAEQHPKWSRMEAGGTVYIENEASRFKQNGHFGVCEKLHYGWMSPANVVRIHPDGPSTECPDCEASGSYKIWAFDRPDVSPSDGKTMALELEYSAGRFLHIFYRSAYVDGAAATYCKRNLASNLDSGASFMSFTEDVSGNDSSFANADVQVGTTWVATPNFAVRQEAANDVSQVPVITVTGGTDWTDCTEDRICPANHDVSITVDFSFKSVETLPAVHQTVRTDVSTPSTGTSTASKTLLRVTDGSEMKMRGAGGEGTFEFSFCSEFGTTVYLYDNYPYSVIQEGAPLGYNSFYAYGSAAFLCCASRVDGSGSVLPLRATGYQAVKVIQESGGHLNLAEIVVSQVGGGSCMENAKCYSFRHDRTTGVVSTGGSWNSADADGLDTRIYDNDFTNNMHSGDPAGPGYFSVCIFETPCLIDEVRVYTGDAAFGWGDRVEEYSVELWAYANVAAFTSPGTDGSRYSPGAQPGASSSPVLVGLLDTYTILKADHILDPDVNIRYVAYSPTVSFPTDIACGFTGTPAARTFDFVSGQSYVLINKDRGSGEVSWSLQATRTACVADAFETAAGGCRECPERLLTFTGDVSSCAAVEDGKAATCALINFAPEASATSAADGFFAIQTTLKNGHPFYRSAAGPKLLYRLPNEDRWVITTETDEATYLAESSGDGLVPFTATDALTYTNNVVRTGIRAVKVIQMKNADLNVAELQIWSRDPVPVNLALTHATCYSGPTVGYWYGGNRETTEQPKLNDDTSDTASSSGDNPEGQAYDICVLDQVYDVSEVRLLPRPGQWARSSNLKVEFWSDFVPAPGGLSPTYATDADLGDLLYTETGDFSSTRGISICTNPIHGPGGADATCAADADTRGTFVTQFCPGLQALLDAGTCTAVQCASGEIIKCPGAEPASILAQC